MWRTGLVGSMLAAVVAAQDTAAQSSEDGRYTLHVPAGWKVTRSGETEDSLRLHLSCEIPGVADEVDVDVYDVVGGVLSPLGQANFERPIHAKAYGEVSADLGLEPLPHLVYRTSKGTTHLFAYRRKAAHGLTIHFSCGQDDFEVRKAQFLAIAESLDAKVDRSPPEPSGYERVANENGIVYMFGPGVRKSTCGALQTAIESFSGGFEKTHGRIERPEDEPLLVIVHKSAAEHEKYWPGTRTLPIFELNVERRIYVVPFEESNIEVRAQLAKSLHRVMYMERYGSDEPRWLSEGLGHLQYAEVWAGKKLPYLHPVFIEGHPRISRLPTEVETLGQEDFERYSRHGFIYGFYFELGPEDVRKAYAAFLGDLAATGDAPGALERHIKPLKLDVASVQAFFDKRAKSHQRR